MTEKQIEARMVQMVRKRLYKLPMLSSCVISQFPDSAKSRG